MIVIVQMLANAPPAPLMTPLDALNSLWFPQCIPKEERRALFLDNRCDAQCTCVGVCIGVLR